MRNVFVCAWFAIICAVAVSACDGAAAPRTPETQPATIPPTLRRLSFPEFSISIELPREWTTNAAPMPYASCANCTSIGPAPTPYPYGIQFWKGTHQVGCDPCYHLTIRTLPRGPTLSIDANGHVAFQQEYERQGPLGLVNTDGDTTLYREILTVVPLEPIGGLPGEAEVPAVFIDAFYRYGDQHGERETRAALADLLASIEILDTAAAP